VTEAVALGAPPSTAPPSPTHDPAAQAADAPQLSFAQWRTLARLCRSIEAADSTIGRLIGPRALPCAQALRQAHAAWRQQRGDPTASHRAVPVRALAALATAAQGLAQRLQARPAGYFKPAGSAFGHGLLLQMPAMKAWLQTRFMQVAAVPHGAPHVEAMARASEAVVHQCMALSGADDSFERRRHLVQLLQDHGHHEPMLRMVQRAGHGWLPKGWAEGWEQLTGIGEDKAAIDALQAAIAQATPALERWAQEPKPAAGPLTPTPAAATPGGPARRPGAQPAGLPVILRARQLPKRWLWGSGAAVVLVLAAGLALHLTAGNGASDARWVIFHVDDAKTMAIDPASIRRDGRQLTYRVGVAWTRERRSSVAVFTADCVTRQRQLETVQHYSGTHYETATRYEVRGTPAGAWPPSGVDVALLRAACAQP
jgi:hypothetical protein